MKGSPIFARMHDLLLWLVPQTLKFPREHRFVMGARVQNTAFNVQERLLEAALTRKGQESEHLDEANVALAKLRSYLRLCHELGLFQSGQYRHVSGMVAEVGRLLGGWQKSVARELAA